MPLWNRKNIPPHIAPNSASAAFGYLITIEQIIPAITPLTGISPQSWAVHRNVFVVGAFRLNAMPVNWLIQPGEEKIRRAFYQEEEFFFVPLLIMLAYWR